MKFGAFASYIMTICSNKMGCYAIEKAIKSIRVFYIDFQMHESWISACIGTIVSLKRK